MNDIHDTFALGPPDDQARDVGSAVDATAPIADPPKPTRKRAPRPTYDDGAPTRVFKFPSKKYPKSSYYVTETEIIIRIRKARQKWKLVVPKKRVVSYRTNRWFAKPRWVEVELTYTQAVRHGLVETSAKPAQPDAAELPSEHDGEDQTALHIPGDQIAPTGFDLDVATQEPPDPAVEELSDQDFAAPETQSSFERTSSNPLADADEMVDCSEAPPPPSIHGQGFLKRRNIDTRVVAPALAAVVLSLSAGLFPTADGTFVSGPCVSSARMPCADDDIVTGSISAAATPHSSTGESATTDRRPPSPEDTPASLQPAQTPASVASTATAVDEHTLDRPPAVSAVDEASENLVRPVEPAIPSDAEPSPLEPSALASADPCVGLAASAASSTTIQFAFASASIPPLDHESLGRLAAMLRQCRDIRLIIEGHTDSDGDFYRNQSLSVRRAEAVRQLLVNYGAGSDQLSVIGFGQMRPLVPNDSSSNKRRNRRIELVVEPHP